METEDYLLKWQKEACQVWIENDQRVLKFILETMHSMVERHQSIDWEEFSSSKGWRAIKAIMSSETQYKFHRLWNECVRKVQKE